jgi:hypothetical protein
LIEKIGVIYQDAISLGFLRGLRDRLQCSAEIVLPATAIGKTRQMPRKAAKSAWEYFRRNGVHLIVRFTDADRNPWRDVHKRALGVVPSEARGLWICGVGVDNPEEWMCRDACCLAGVLSVPIDELLNPANRVGRVKHALGQVKRPDEKLSDAVARIVRDAPTEVFRRWLEDPALRTFYTDCRAAATAADCDTPNELEQSQSQDE